MHTFFVIFFISTFLLHATTSDDLSSELAALLSLRSALRGRTLLWNTTHPTPCNWQGVSCTNNRVTSLRLPASSLSGPLIPALSNLTHLRTLSLRLNRISGPLPDELSKLTQLRNLYLHGNYFSGHLSLSSLPSSLVRLNLADNNFSGEIPSGFDNFTRLRSLNLEDNWFTGSLPDIQLPGLLQFNVSFNRNLTGFVPKGLRGIPKGAFLGTSLCGEPLGSRCAGNGGERSTTIGIEKSSGRSGLAGGVIAGIVIGCVVGLFLLLLVFVLLCRNRERKTRSLDVAPVVDNGDGVEKVENGGLSNGFSVVVPAAAMNANVGKGENGGNTKKLVFFPSVSRVFDLEELLRASAEVLGKGTFGTTYKAILEVGTVVAVKRLKDIAVSEGEFKQKVERVGALEHENLLPPRAYYYSRDEKLVVYDYMPMGSLSAFLHGNKGASRTPLNWDTRSRIALGTARGIEFLHSQNPNTAHGNIKSSNILLTNSYNPRVSDFGVNQLVGPLSTPARVTGYRAPEVIDPRSISQKADVYSFGVLLLELLTGKAPIQALLNDEGVDLPKWVQSIAREEWTSEVFDLELLQNQTVKEEMFQLLQLGIDCSAQYPDNRPSISEVVKKIEELGLSSCSESDQEQSDHRFNGTL